MNENEKREVLTDQIIKTLLRCRKFMEAKDEIIKILVFVNKRELLLNVLEDEIDNIAWNEAKTVYSEIVKISFRTYNQIEKLRVDNPMLNRPFIFNKNNV